MINLDISVVDNYSVEYGQEMIGKVCDNLETQINNNNKNKAINQKLIYFFGPTLSDRKNLIEDLLTISLDIIKEKNLNIKEYFMTSEFVFHSGFKIMEEVAKERKNHYLTDSELKEIVISKYIEKYSVKNGWLERKLNARTFDTKVSFDEFVDDIKKELDEFNKEISKVFNYEKMIDSELRHEIMFRFGIEVCPYCNRNFISNYKKKVINPKTNSTYYVNRTTSDLDHFYAKSKYPLFALSLYNFVPSCQICNSRFKIDKTAEIIHPFSEKIDYSKMKFSLVMNSNSSLEVFFGESKEFEIQLITSDLAYKNHIDVFKLEEMYSHHKSLVSELMFKKTAYDNTYMKTIDNLFSSYDLFNVTKEHKEIFLYGIKMNQEEFFKKPLSKLIFDIVNEN